MGEEIVNMNNKREVEEKGHTRYQWAVAIAANSTLISYGLQSGWISPMTSLLQSPESPVGILTPRQVSLLASIMCLVAVAATPAYSYIADRWGRRTSILIISVMQTICWAVKLAFPSFVGLVISRIFCGIGSAGCFNMVPIYTKEISQDSIRGTLGSLLMLLMNLGFLTIYLLGAYLDYFLVLWIALFVPIVSLCCLLAAPESPSFLVKMNRIEEATVALAQLRGVNQGSALVYEEVCALRKEEEFYRSLPPISFCAIFKDKAWRRGFLIVLVIITAQACNGNFAVLTYASVILSSTGVLLPPHLTALSFPLVMTLGSFVSIASVDRLGRKTLFLSTMTVTGGCMLLLGGAVLLAEQGTAVPGWLTVSTILVSLFAYAVGVLPVPYVVMAEMFNFQIRARLMGCIVTHAWLMSFVQLFIFAPSSAAVGFFLFAVVDGAGTVFTLLCMPETRGRSAEDIEDILRK